MEIREHVGYIPCMSGEPSIDKNKNKKKITIFQIQSRSHCYSCMSGMS